MSRHTPGPWEVCRGATRYGSTWIGGGSADAARKAGFLREVCAVHEHHSEAKANARLIAAAPTLLKGLKLAVMEFERIAYQKKCDPEILADLKRAIVLAEGP